MGKHSYSKYAKKMDVEQDLSLLPVISNIFGSSPDPASNAIRFNTPNVQTTIVPTENNGIGAEAIVKRPSREFHIKAALDMSGFKFQFDWMDY